MSLLVNTPNVPQKVDREEIFLEYTRSICPECRKTIDAQVLVRDNKVYMHKRCKEHGWFDSLISGDARMYVDAQRYNKPGTLPLKFDTEVKEGCPEDCGLCEEHKQHTCLAIIEINEDCNLECPTCFSSSGNLHGFQLTLQEVEGMLDHLVEAEGNPEVVQFSGGEPTLHPQLVDMILAARKRGIKYVMVNTNAVRLAKDEEFLDALSAPGVQPAIYMQFDGFKASTYETIRGVNLLPQKIKALDNLAERGMSAVLVACIIKGVNDDEIGEIIRFAMKHPAVRGVSFQPGFYEGRHLELNPMDRFTIPDVAHAIEDQTQGVFTVSDLIPIPCPFPLCSSTTYAYVENGGEVCVPLPRVINMDDYLDYFTNRTVPEVPKLSPEIQLALEALWSASAVPGSDKVENSFGCASCNIELPEGLEHLERNIFMIVIKGFMDAYTFDVRRIMKCCVSEVTSDNKLIPFCAYNNVGYREENRDRMRNIVQSRGKKQLKVLAK
jgi:uncharacterized radical SAM superfamily Fe-S cluster-containing enzyme